ncbi:MAG: hypothetical protein ABJF50_06950 [Paracoccaceae bacterium]
MESIDKMHFAERQVIVVLSDQDFEGVKFEVNPSKSKRQRILGRIQTFFFGNIAEKTSIFKTDF